MKSSLAILTSFLLILPVAPAASVSGTAGKTLFANYRDNYGGNFIDFTMGVPPMPSDRRLDTEFATTLGVTFSTFQNANLVPIGPHNVYVSNGLGNPGLVNTIVGTPSAGSGDDGRYPYQIEFAQPQRYAGVQRIWSADTRTRFYTADGTLLFEGPGNDFFGYQADSDDTATWVSRIEITGINQQVGYTDDLFFGTSVPEPGAAGLTSIALALLAFLRRKSP